MQNLDLRKTILNKYFKKKSLFIERSLYLRDEFVTFRAAAFNIHMSPKTICLFFLLKIFLLSLLLQKFSL